MVFSLCRCNCNGFFTYFPEFGLNAPFQGMCSSEVRVVGDASSHISLSFNPSLPPRIRNYIEVCRRALLNLYLIYTRTYRQSIKIYWTECSNGSHPLHSYTSLSQFFSWKFFFSSVPVPASVFFLYIRCSNFSRLFEPLRPRLQLQSRGGHHELRGWSAVVVSF